MDFHTLHKDYKHFFKNGANARPKYNVIFYMALDAEWHESNGRNVVLSYQVATVSVQRSNNIIEYVPHGHRLTLTELVEMGIRSVTNEDEFRALRGQKVQVILISHNVAAEMSVLADRDEPHITKRIALVRKSPITDGHVIKITLTHGIPVGVKIFDTMLLAPVTHRSLKKLSELIGSKEKEKETITQFYIENMNLYLEDYPERFEEYALKDSEITLMLFFLLQQSLNELVLAQEVGALPAAELKEMLGSNIKLYRTLASAGVTSFTSQNEWFKEYREQLPQKYTKPHQLVSRSYYGGRNESYFVGRTKDHPETRDKIWVDIDFTGCYPTAMALTPKIDVDKPADHIPRQYKIDDKLAAELIAENIPEELVTRAREALEVSQQEFDRVLMDMKPKGKSWEIRKKASVTDNRLVNRWYRKWKKAREANDTAAMEKVSIPGFARVEFTFPSDTQFPCLPIRHQDYGLIYPLHGETTVPASEIMLAMDAGAKIKALTSVEFPIAQDEEGQPVRFVLGQLSSLATMRAAHKRKIKEASKKLEEEHPGKEEKKKLEKEIANASIMEKLLKEFTNSFYGKFAQSITPRNVFHPATGEMMQLGESVITEPCTAALVTSLARSALSATLLAVEWFNKGKSLRDQVTVISATTDGLLVGIPTPENLTVVDDYYCIYEGKSPKLKGDVEGALPDILKRFNCQGILDELEKFLSIRQMRNSRTELTGNGEILEIKHLVDEIVSIKTRGQIGFVSTGHTQLLARFNLKPPLSEIIEDPEEYKRIMEAGGVERNTEDAKWIMERIDEAAHPDADITTYPFITLQSFTKIAKSGGKLDLTKNISTRKINTDFDWKRKLVWSDAGKATGTASPFSIPYADMAEMITHRNAMEAIRRTGKVAHPHKVLQRIEVKGSTTRARGGEPVAVTRLFLRAMLQGKLDMHSPLDSYPVAAEKVNDVWEIMGLSETYPKTWSINDFKNNKRGRCEFGRFARNTLLEELIQRLAETFHADPVATVATVFSSTELTTVNALLAEYVITAVIQAPRLGIKPFYDLQQEGLLPDQRRLRDTFRHHLTDKQIKECCKAPFTPGKFPSSYSKNIKNLLYLTGIPSKNAAECAKALVQTNKKGKVRKNPGGTKCTDHFVQALLQSDIRNREMKVTELIRNLKRYGLTKSRYYSLKRGRFKPNCIKNTPLNRQQINKMARACGHDPLPLLDQLLEQDAPRPSR